MGSVSFLTVNCQGLGNIEEKKRCVSFSEIESNIISMWGFDCFFSSFSSNSRGVSILFNSNFEYEVLKEKRDLNGNYLALDVVIDKPKLTLLSLYGPNMDNPDFL